MIQPDRHRSGFFFLYLGNPVSLQNGRAVLSDIQEVPHETSLGRNFDPVDRIDHAEFVRLLTLENIAVYQIVRQGKVDGKWR